MEGVHFGNQCQYQQVWQCKHSGLEIKLLYYKNGGEWSSTSVELTMSGVAKYYEADYCDGMNANQIVERILSTTHLASVKRPLRFLGDDTLL